MSHDAINSWVQQAKSGNRSEAAVASQEVRVVRSAPQSKGNILLELADKLFPDLMKLLEGVRDGNGMVLQPAHIRALSIDVAQGYIKKYEGNK